MTARFGGHSYFFLYTRRLRQGEMSGPLEDKEFGHRGCWQSNVPGVKGLIWFNGIFFPKIISCTFRLAYVKYVNISIYI